MHAKPRCTAPDDIGYSSMDSEYKIDSSWKLVIMEDKGEAGEYNC
jgi:hypothetical protein